jgi:membrane protein DedA with SNARE-associated domain
MLKSKFIAWVAHHGYLGLTSILALGFAGAPFPDEIILTFAGYQVHLGHLRLLPTIAAAFVGSTIGICVSYALGRLAGASLLDFGERHSLIHASSVALVERWFARIGKWTLTVCFFVPTMRHIVAIVAGTFRLPAYLFALFAGVGALLWSAAFVTLGMVFGNDWARLAEDLRRHLVRGGIAVGGLVVLWFAWQVWRNRRRNRGTK